MPARLKFCVLLKNYLNEFFSNFMTFPNFYSSKVWCNFGVINSFLTPSHCFFDYFIKREKKAAKSKKKANYKLFIKKLRPNGSLTL